MHIPDALVLRTGIPQPGGTWFTSETGKARTCLVRDVVILVQAVRITSLLAWQKTTHVQVLGPKAGVHANDTSPIFNWHPLLMSLAFPVRCLHVWIIYKVLSQNTPAIVQRLQEQSVLAGLYG